tara:strand:- start:70 stop:774 length:705 start_codon:yes stop_codon:yes gene_type:complete
MTDMENKTAEPTEAQTQETEATASEQSTQEQKFSQADIDKIVADRIARERRKFEKKYEGVDVDQYKELTAKQEKEREDRLKAKGEFEKILKETVDKNRATIETLQSQISSIKVDGALVDTASKYRAISPNQVVKLLKEQVRLNESGDVEVVDAKTGQTRYGEDGTHLTIDSLVKEFITENPHFVAAGPAGSGSTSRVGDSGAGETLDISKLDMSNAEHRKIYADYRKKSGLGPR